MTTFRIAVLPGDGIGPEVVAIAALVTLAAIVASAAEPPWRELFNGRDLAGWRIVGAELKARTWVGDGAITGPMVRGKVWVNSVPTAHLHPHD